MTQVARPEVLSQISELKGSSPRIGTGFLSLDKCLVKRARDALRDVPRDVSVPK